MCGNEMIGVIGWKSLTGSMCISGVQDRIDRHHAHVGEEQRVAVGRRLLGGLRRDVAAAAAAVVDDDRLLQRLGNLRGDRPDHHVGAAAGRKRHQERDRARRIAVGLRGRDRCGREPSRDRAGQGESCFHDAIASARTSITVLRRMSRTCVLDSNGVARCKVQRLSQMTRSPSRHLCR